MTQNTMYTTFHIEFSGGTKLNGFLFPITSTSWNLILTKFTEEILKSSLNGVNVYVIQRARYATLAKRIK